jgi:16S rRNA (uracil1498-N3)-methyltransferase
MPVFYVTQLILPEAILDEDESRHLVRVLRLKKDDPVDLVDGAGNLYKCAVAEADPRKTRLRILQTFREHLARDYQLHIAIAPTKSSDRFEWFLEKSTEIGIDEITPVFCQRSERDRIRQDRSEKIILAAMKQSGRAYLPKLNPMIPFKELLERAEAEYKYIAHCGTRTEDLAEKPASSKLSWLVLIGPEGDFTPDELKMATGLNYIELSLGEAVYRTETAGILACQQIRFLNMGL